MRALARASGMKLGALQYHFRTWEDLPLAGVANSGMGAYHGHHGFLQFSHSKAVYHQGLFSLGKFLRPPYTPRKIKIIDSMV
jgi:coniferyl-aldehyde dehydrogenase